MRSVLRLVLAVAVVVNASTAHGQSTIFSDSFTGGASPLWGSERGGWYAAGGNYGPASPNNVPPTYSSLPFTLGDFTVDTDILGANDGGVFLRSSDPDNGVLFVHARGEIYFHLAVNGSYSGPLDQVFGAYTVGSDVHVRLTVAGDVFTAALTSGSVTTSTSLTDGTFSSGRVALYSNSGERFDNVVLASGTPEPGSLILLGTGAAALLSARRRRA